MRTSKIQNGRQVYGCSRQLSPNKFFDPSIPSMRKVDDGEKKREKRKECRLVATNVVASRLPGRQPTGTPHTCAKNDIES